MIIPITYPDYVKVASWLPLQLPDLTEALLSPYCSPKDKEKIESAQSCVKIVFVLS